MLREGDYVLRVRDDSLWSEQVRSGDYLIIRSSASAEADALVLAMRPEEGTTIGRMVPYSDGVPRLRPVGSRVDLEVGVDGLTIRGVVTGVVRIL